MRTSPGESPRRDGHLVVEDLSAGYKKTAIIRGVDVAVSKGEVVTVIGPNGAGKSTLLKSVMGLLEPMAGSISLGGEPIGGLPANKVAAKGVGYVPQVRDVFETLSVKENLEMGGYHLRRPEVQERIEEVLLAYPQLKGMLTRSAGKISGGERKMVAIGRVLMTRPSLVILDEPTAGLSPKLAQQMLEQYVARLTAREVAVLLVEQRAREALEISQYAYVLASGEVKLESAAASILDRDDLGQVFLGRTEGAA
ncbi:MAG: ABC transporter ATP-binding protein [Actinobacteria bacterium]|nr:ABC transporter ATP-binding protein [Actinomycetota bacterium]